MFDFGLWAGDWNTLNTVGRVFSFLIFQTLSPDFQILLCWHQMGSWAFLPKPSHKNTTTLLLYFTKPSVLDFSPFSVFLMHQLCRILVSAWDLFSLTRGMWSSLAFFFTLWKQQHTVNTNKKNPFFRQVSFIYILCGIKGDGAALWGQLPRALAMKAWSPMGLWSTCGVCKHSHLSLLRKGRATAAAVGTRSPGT